MLLALPMPVFPCLLDWGLVRTRAWDGSLAGFAVVFGIMGTPSGEDDYETRASYGRPRLYILVLPTLAFGLGVFSDDSHFELAFLVAGTALSLLVLVSLLLWPKQEWVIPKKGPFAKRFLYRSMFPASLLRDRGRMDGVFRDPIVAQYPRLHGTNAIISVEVYADDLEEMR